MNHHNPSHHEDEPSAFWRSRYAIGLLVMSAVAGYFLISEHRAHFFGALPYLLLLACPLMHFFMHGSHGRHGGGHAGHDSSRPVTDTSKPKDGEKP
jgi:hypothetical protein